MNEWFYAQGGKQNGPVTKEALVELAKNGGLNPLNDLVWTSTMKDWLPAGQVPGIFNTIEKPAAPPADPSNPYAAPESTWTAPPVVQPGESLPEIEPGSQPISARACIKRGFDLVMRNFGMLLLILIVYIVVSGAVAGILGVMDSALGLTPPAPPLEVLPAETPGGFNLESVAAGSNTSFLNDLLSSIFSTFMTLGLCRIGLNLVSGKPIEIGMLFGGAKKVLPAFLASILYGVMVGVGLLLLIVPGIYLGLRYGQFMFAIVDKDLGIMDSFKYSSSITTNNRMKLFVLGILSFLVVLAGMLALLVGLVVALPVAWVSWVVAYRWMQYGFSAALDQPGTKTPMLAASA